MATRIDTDLVIIGGGPAGCSAAVMAASLGMTSVVVEPQSLCHKLESVSSLVNVLGRATTGSDLAATIRQDVAQAPGCEILLGQRAAHVRAASDHVRVQLDGHETLTALFAIVATGVGPLRLTDVDWIDTYINDPPPLWQATPADLADTEIIVLGVDRPLGTLLRSMPDIATRLIVAYHPTEHYKASEVQHDSRVVLLPSSHAHLQATTDGMVSLRTSPDSTRTAAQIFRNLGSRPLVPQGDLTTGQDGYCPPERQHPRVLVAGDLRSARYQRIMTAFGSGAEAALTAYYQLAGVQ